MVRQKLFKFEKALCSTSYIGPFWILQIYRHLCYFNPKKFEVSTRLKRRDKQFVEKERQKEEKSMCMGHSEMRMSGANYCNKLTKTSLKKLLICLVSRNNKNYDVKRWNTNHGFSRFQECNTAKLTEHFFKIAHEHGFPLRSTSLAFYYWKSADFKC